MSNSECIKERSLINSLKDLEGRANELEQLASFSKSVIDKINDPLASPNEREKSLEQKDSPPLDIIDIFNSEIDRITSSVDQIRNNIEQIKSFIGS